MNCYYCCYEAEIAVIAFLGFLALVYWIHCKYPPVKNK